MGRSRNVVRRSARIDLLMGEPTFDLQKPACSKVTFVSENSRVPIDPVVIEWSKRKIGVVHPLLVRDAAWVAAVKSAGVEIECEQLVFVRPIAHVKVSLPQIVLAVIALSVCSHVPSIQSKFQRTHCFLNHIVGGIISVTAADLFGIEIPWRTRRRIFCYKVHYWRRLRSVKQAAAAANELNFFYALRQRQVVKSRKPNPITHQRQTVPKDKGELGFLRVAQSSVAEIKLSWRVLLRNQKSRGFDEKILVVVIFYWRLLVELDHRRFFRDCDCRALYFRQEVLPHLSEIIVRCRRCYGLTRDDDSGCFYS